MKNENEDENEKKRQTRRQAFDVSAQFMKIPYTNQ